MTEARQTRGFLFADLRDYSRFTERYGDDAAARLLGRYRAIVRDVIGRFGGAEIRTEGDSFYVVFNSVGHAVNAGLAILDGANTASTEAGDAPIRVGIESMRAKLWTASRASSARRSILPRGCARQPDRASCW